MSLAEKLYRIGECVEDDEIIQLIRQKPIISDEKTHFFFMNFLFENDKYIDMRIIEQKVDSEFFFTGAIGGRGSGYYYLYPNLIFENKKDKSGKQEVEKKIVQFINTLENYLDKGYIHTKHNHHINTIIDVLKKENTKKQLDEKKEYLFALLINGKSFYEQYPEILREYLDNPVSDFSKGKQSLQRGGRDFLTGEAVGIGFNPDVKIFTLDNYDDSHKNRIVDNLEISRESAKCINRGWLYAIEYLMFYYKGLNYLVIPNFIKEEVGSYKKILDTLKTANSESLIKRNEIREKVKHISDSITQIAKEEKNLLKLLEKPKKGKKEKKIASSLFDDLENNEKNLSIVRKEKENLEREKNELEFLIKDDLLDEIGEIFSKKELKEFLNGISLDLIFVNYDTKYGTVTNIYGTIQDVIPSKISDVKQKMRSFGIEDGIKLKGREKSKVYLQDYFSRFELLAKLSKTINEKNVQNMEFKERIYLAKLLLSEEQISYENLLNRFEQNREYDYEGKKRIGKKDGVKEWLNDPKEFLEKEQRVIGFLKSIDSLKGVEYGR
ncbi:MAG: hypothetical protein GXX07_10565 [Wolinella succinogenes]|uniref:TM1802 family CRISPR-associated protein n=1 Tax=Wolinella succinogenes TaxID=844 RepID=UPI0016AF9BC6|nr:TM1802 family CRISPR-associated protein [Wolinella succinogenes]NLU35393.1 hypothetical protein [Wolinella succinogenes]